jgi:hypothetical protein
MHRRKGTLDKLLNNSGGSPNSSPQKNAIDKIATESKIASGHQALAVVLSMAM